MGACEAQGLNYKLTGYSPSGLDKFGSSKNLAYLCEEGAVAILYDCKLKTPLYAATVMDKKQLNARYVRPNSNFRRSSTSLDPKYQQKARDYKYSSKVKICYKKKAVKTDRFVDRLWFKAKNLIFPPFTKCNQESQNDKLFASIHRGHLIAAQYGRGKKTRIVATFRYTNTVPQFGSVNSGLWNSKEQALVTWGRNNCANPKDKKENVKMHIIVGAIPSTFARRSFQPKYYGPLGFSDSQSDDYPINVPTVTWTAACCTFSDKNDEKIARHTFFAVENIPQAVDNLPTDSEEFFKEYTSQTIVLFPKQPGCKDKNNYRKLC